MNMNCRVPSILTGSLKFNVTIIGRVNHRKLNKIAHLPIYPFGCCISSESKIANQNYISSPVLNVTIIFHIAMCPCRLHDALVSQVEYIFASGLRWSHAIATASKRALVRATNIVSTNNTIKTFKIGPDLFCRWPITRSTALFSELMLMSGP